MASLYLLAALLRLALVVYGAYHDEVFEVRYTDIDYDVFSDGAQLVWRGRSPFERPTYRYTPLLAALLTPNVWLHPAFGKLLFATADLLVGELVPFVAQPFGQLLLRRRQRARCECLLVGLFCWFVCFFDRSLIQFTLAQPRSSGGAL